MIANRRVLFYEKKYPMGLLNISIPWHISALGDIDISSRREWSKESVQQGRSIACCVPQGATAVGARSVRPVREHDKRARTPLAAFFNIPPMKMLVVNLSHYTLQNLTNKGNRVELVERL